MRGDGDGERERESGAGGRGALPWPLALVLALLLLGAAAGEAAGGGACVDRDAELAALAAAAGFLPAAGGCAAVPPFCTRGDYAAAVQALCPATCGLCPGPGACARARRMPGPCWAGGGRGVFFNPVPRAVIDPVAAWTADTAGALLPDAATLGAGPDRGCLRALTLADYAVPGGLLPPGYFAAFPAVSSLTLTDLGLTALRASDLESMAALVFLYACFLV